MEKLGLFALCLTLTSCSSVTYEDGATRYRNVSVGQDSRGMVVEVDNGAFAMAADRIRQGESFTSLVNSIERVAAYISAQLTTRHLSDNQRRVDTNNSDNATKVDTAEIRAETRQVELDTRRAIEASR